MESKLAKDSLTLDISPSMTLCLLLLASHILAISGIVYSGSEITYQLVAGCVVVISFLYCFYRHGLLTHGLSVRTIDYRNKKWLLGLKSGEQLVADIQSPVFVISFLVVLNFKDAAGRNFPVALLPDAVDGTQLRHSQIFLRLGSY